ncbi:MAG: ankyrin repeat domain-containing protein [Parashewanella sp.]
MATVTYTALPVKTAQQNASQLCTSLASNNAALTYCCPNGKNFNFKLEQTGSQYVCTQSSVVNFFLSHLPRPIVKSVLGYEVIQISIDDLAQANTVMEHHKANTVTTISEPALIVRGLKRSEEFVAACRKNNIRKACTLFESGVNVNHRDAFGRTALHYLCENSRSSNNTRLIQQLIACSANVNVKDKSGNTAIDLTRVTGNLASLQQLVAAAIQMEEQSPKPNFNRKYNDNFTLLHFAAACGDKKSVAKLLQYTSSFSPRNSTGTTPLIFAVMNQQFNTVQFLLNDQRCNASIINQRTRQTGRTALHYAAEKVDRQLYDLLAKHGADEGIRDKNGDIAEALFTKKHDDSNSSRTHPFKVLTSWLSINPYTRLF